MNLGKFFAQVTGLKTACTHAGLEADGAEIEIHSQDGQILSIVVSGVGKHGPVTLKFGK